MNDITYAVSIDVNNPIIPYNVYVASVLDSNVRYLEITLYQNGNVIALSNTAAATASLVTDNVLVDGSVNCTISDNIITVPLEDLQRHGNLDVQVTVTEGTKVLAIPFPIQVRVTPNIAENAQIDENSLGSYAEVVHEIAEARGTYTTLHDAITAKLDGKLTVKPIPEGGYNDCTESNTLYYGYAGGYYIYVLPVVVTGSSNQSQYKLRADNSLIECRTRHYSNGAWGSWDNWTPVGREGNIADGAITWAKLAAALQTAINAKAPASTAYTFDSTTTNVVYNVANPKTIYTNAYVNGKSAFVLTTADNYYQIALCYDGSKYTRQLTGSGSTTYNPWLEEVIAEEVGDLKSDLSEMQTATSEDIGKALKAKAVENGKVTEWEFGEAGGEEKYEAKEKQYDAYSNSYCYVVGTGMVVQANRCLVRAEVSGYEKARITCPVTFGNETENKPNIYTLDGNSEVVSAMYLGDNYEVNSYEVSLDGVSLLGIVTNFANIGNIRIELLTPIIFEDDRVTPLIYEGASGINRCNINDFVKGYYIQNGKATFANGSSFRTSGYCYVKDLSSVVVRIHKEDAEGTEGTTVYFTAVYDENKNYIGTTTSPHPGVLGIPENGCYLRFSINDSIFETLDNIIVEKYSNPILVQNSPYAPNRYFINAGEYLKYKGKKWVCVGDSLTERNVRATWFYHDYIAFSTGISVYNMGKSGTGYHRGDSFYARIQNIPTDADVVTFFGSFNDLGDSYPLGTKDDTELTTVAGYINATFDRLNSILPMVPYGVITPTPWKTANPMEYGDDSRASTYVNLLIDICKKRGIPLLDLYHCSLLRSWDMNYHDYAFSLDDANANTHPNSEGHKLIAPRIAAFLDTLIMPYGIETINW